MEEVFVEMYRVRISVRRVEESTEDLWVSKVALSTICKPNKKVYDVLDERRLHFENIGLFTLCKLTKLNEKEFKHE